MQHQGDEELRELLAAHLVPEGVIGHMQGALAVRTITMFADAFAEEDLDDVLADFADPRGRIKAALQAAWKEAKEMKDISAAASSGTTCVAEPEPFQIHLMRDRCGQDWGLQLCLSESFQEFVVGEVLPGGIADKMNQQQQEFDPKVQPNCLIRAGDRILRVNGVEESEDMLLEFLEVQHTEVFLACERGATPATSSTQPTPQPAQAPPQPVQQQAPSPPQPPQMQERQQQEERTQQPQPLQQEQQPPMAEAIHRPDPPPPPPPQQAESSDWYTEQANEAPGEAGQVRTGTEPIVTDLIPDPEITRQLRSSSSERGAGSPSSPQEPESPVNSMTQQPQPMTREEAVKGGECVVVKSDDIRRDVGSGYIAPSAGSMVHLQGGENSVLPGEKECDCHLLYAYGKSLEDQQEGWIRIDIIAKVSS